MEKLDFKTILMGILASLCGYVFYGYIALQAEVNVLKTRVEQNRSELRDLWNKYNDQLDKEVNFITKFYDFKIKEQSDNDEVREDISKLRTEMRETELRIFKDK